MTINTTLVKRPALHKGEVGLFPNNPMAEEDLGLVAMFTEMMVSMSSERRLEALKFLWALVHKTAENSDYYLDKDEAMKDLKLRVGYTREVRNTFTGEMEVRPKSLTRISDERLRFLTNRMMDVICRDILPGMKPNDMRKEIEEMLGLGQASVVVPKARVGGSEGRGLHPVHELPRMQHSVRRVPRTGPPRDAAPDNKRVGSDQERKRYRSLDDGKETALLRGPRR